MMLYFEIQDSMVCTLSAVKYAHCAYCRKNDVLNGDSSMAKKDFTQVAHSVFQQDIGLEKKTEPLTSPKAKSYKGGEIGGANCTKGMAKEQLSEPAKKSANARWGKDK